MTQVELEAALNRTLASLQAQNFGKPQLQALLMWFAKDQALESSTGQLTEQIVREQNQLMLLLEELSKMSPEACYAAIEKLSLDDMVRFAVLQEFGPGFAKKGAYNLLVRYIKAHLLQRLPQEALEGLL